MQTGGVHMNTWVVGHAPVGHHKPGHGKSKKLLKAGEEKTASSAEDQQLLALEQAEEGQQTFFMKARIMAGALDLAQNKLGLEDHKWLTRAEIQSHVRPGYWSAVRHMLAER